ncbi:Uu.00g054100.m01.CDS01 [Anthostomella pinea]|uniref:Uu.00g054100.m01.CDS01 n=1 Tax=Anthostomella pinea TaxID=933095 RepID=A0AAI8YPM6_9PEZI|nr:Uu.00g054100.m01.CDS01 [Anthostomella pinea]
MRSDGHRVVDIDLLEDDELVPLPRMQDLRIYTLDPMASRDVVVDYEALIETGNHVDFHPNLQMIETLASAWLKECFSNHEDCITASTASAADLPTRLLGLGDVEKHGVVRLWHTKGARGQYTALSHRWGSSQPAKTTKANLAARLQGFPRTELPQTFCDAVEVTLCLGIRYLWIDSLCMVQDDHDDWKDQPAQMGDLYRNAHVTIAATRALNSDSGFLGPRKRTAIARLQPRRGCEQEVYISHRRSFAEDVEKAPLNRRAWVFQERILSPRILRFTETQVYWECWTMHQGEDLESKQLGMMKRETYPSSLAPHSVSSDAPSKPAQWLKMSAQYSELQLSFPSDRLVAISGLISRMAVRTARKFYKGVSLEYMHMGLLWSSVNPPMDNLGANVAPSWGWASHQGAINYVQLYLPSSDPDLRFVEEIRLPWSSDAGDIDYTLQGHSTKLRADFRLEREAHKRQPEGWFPVELHSKASVYHKIRCSNPDHYGDGIFGYISELSGDNEDWNDIFGWVTLDEENGFVADVEGLRFLMVLPQPKTRSKTPDSEGPLISDEESELSFSMEVVNVGEESNPRNESDEKALEPPLSVRHCMLIKQSSDGKWRRVGIAALYDERCLMEGEDSEIVEVH